MKVEFIYLIFKNQASKLIGESNNLFIIFVSVWAKLRKLWLISPDNWHDLTTF